MTWIEPTGAVTTLPVEAVGLGFLRSTRILFAKQIASCFRMLPPLSRSRFVRAATDQDQINFCIVPAGVRLVASNQMIRFPKGKGVMVD